MPRTKSAPARRREVPPVAEPLWSASKEEGGDAERHNDSQKLQDRRERDVERDGSARPAKRRRTAPRAIEDTYVEAQLSNLLEEELLSFLELRVASVDPEGLGATETVILAGQIKRDIPTVNVSFALKLADGSLADEGSTAIITAPSLVTATNLIALLEGGILGLAYVPLPPYHIQDNKPSASPVLYACDSGALPRPLVRRLTPTSGAGPASYERTTSQQQDLTAGGGCGRSPAATCTDSTLQNAALGITHGELPGQELAGCEDWQPAIYLAASTAFAMDDGGDDGGTTTCPCGGLPGTSASHSGCLANATPYRSVVTDAAAAVATGGGGHGGTACASAVYDSDGPRAPRGAALRLGVTAAALERLRVGDPEDTQQRVWQTQLLSVLTWLLPHNAAGEVEGASLAAPGRHAGAGLGAGDDQEPRGSPLGSPPETAATKTPRCPPPGMPSALGSPSSAPVTARTTASPSVTAANATANFDAGWLYGAVKPSGLEPQWQGELPELRPRLRPYQRRAVAWMLQRERPYDGGGAPAVPSHGTAPPLHPLWRRLHVLPRYGGGGAAAPAALYVNAYSGALASEAFPPPGPMYGGILADEMGLGKTVELLALITANRYGAEQAAGQRPAAGGQGPAALRRQRQRPAEHVECPCGVRCDDPQDPEVEDYTGLWILCEACNAWMHGSCVGVRRAPRSAWVCSRCLRAKALETVSEPCGATLIVVPSAILQQWYDEIRRHVRPGALRVVVYGGQRQPGATTSGLICGAFTGGGGGGGGGAAGGRRNVEARDGDLAESMVVSAAQLAAADVVLTTYDVLKRDVSRQPEQEAQERNMRHHKKYEVVPTPLTRLRWWRVVLDEAQMVESSTAKAAEMALKLDTVHRWCVTGTPISRGLEDLYGLMAFLGARPWSRRSWWNRCVQRPVEAGDPAGRCLLLRLLRPQASPAAAGTAAAAATAGASAGVFSGAGRGGGDAGVAFGCGGAGGGRSGLMWRSAKRDVEGELGLLPQSNHLSSLRLNAVELHFYNRQHQDCAAKARAVLPPRVVAAIQSGRLYDNNNNDNDNNDDNHDSSGSEDAGEGAPSGAGAGGVQPTEVAAAAGSGATEVEGLGLAAAGPSAGAWTLGAGAAAAGPAGDWVVSEPMEVVESAPCAVPAAAAAGSVAQQGSSAWRVRGHPHTGQEQQQGVKQEQKQEQEMKQAGQEGPCQGLSGGQEHRLQQPGAGAGRDPLREVHELQRRRWQQWREQQEAAEAAADAEAEAGGGGGGGAAAAAGMAAAGPSAGVEKGAGGGGGGDVEEGVRLGGDVDVLDADVHLWDMDVADAAGAGGRGRATTASGLAEGEPKEAEAAPEAATGGGGGGGGRRAAGGGAGAANGVGGVAGRVERPASTSVRKALAAASSSLDRQLAPHEARKLLGPLLKLRQACCHPQVGAGGIRSLAGQGGAHPHPHLHSYGPGSSHRHDHGPMTMTEILAVLITKAKTEAEEAQRQLIAAQNGLSALMMIQGDIAEAVATYRRSLRTMEDNKPEIGADAFQRLHTLHNLAQVLASPAATAAAIPRTLRDHTLAEEAAAIRARFLEQRRGKLAVAEAEYRELVSASSPFHGAVGWYLAAIDLLISGGHDSAAAVFIREKLLEDDTYRQKTEVNASSMAHRFSSLVGLKALLNDSLDAIELHRSVAMRTLEQLGAKTRMEQPPPAFVEQAGLCGRCRAGPRRSLTCEHCREDELFIQWEVRLFALYSKALTAGATVTAEEAARRAYAAMVRFAGRGGLHEEGATSAGEEEALEEGGLDGRRVGANVSTANTSWRQSEAEMVLRLLVSQLKQHFKRTGGLDDDRVEAIIREGKSHVDRLEAQRRLLVAARSVSLEQRMLLYAHDELGMATLRMRLAEEGEPIAKHEVNLKLHSAAVPVKNVELSNERVVSEADLRRTLGTLRYLCKLQTIQNQQQEQRSRQQQQLCQQQQQQDEQPRQDQQQQEQRHPREQDQGAEAATGAAIASTAAAPSGAGGTIRAGLAAGPSNAPGASAGLSSGAVPPTCASAAAATQPKVNNGAEAVGTGTAVTEAAATEPEVELCPICHESIDCLAAPSVIMPCGHQMHLGCSEALVAKTVAHNTPYNQKRVNCPTCRTRVHVAEIAYIDAALTHGSEQTDGSRTGGPGSGAGDGGPWAGEASVAVRGSYGTKIEAVVRRIKFVLGEDPAAKVLVFSAWVDLLELVAAALRENGVPYVVARGRGGMAAALAAFKDLPGDQLDGVQGLQEDDDEEGEAVGEGGGPHVLAGAEAPAPAPAPAPAAKDEAKDEDEHEDALHLQQAHCEAHPSFLAGRREGEARGRSVTPQPPLSPPPLPSTPPAVAAGDAAGADVPSPGQQAVATGTPVTSAAGLSPPSPLQSALPQPSAGGGDGAAGGSCSKRGRTGVATPGQSGLASPARGSVVRRSLLVSPTKSSQAKPRVLLLQLKQGGAGLNLTEAQHVVLVEPQLDPALEAQAVGRVHRIGQTRPTHVHRFVVVHTVEEQVHKLAAARARGMDLAAAVPASRGHHGRGGGGNGGGGGDGSEHLTVRDVAVLLDTRWGAAAPAPAPAAAAPAAETAVAAAAAAAAAAPMRAAGPSSGAQPGG